MIPYIELTTIQLGPIPIQVWGVMVALGFILGAMASAKMIKHRGLDSKHLYDMLGWIILASMIGGRLFVVLFYDPAYYLANPLEIFAIWHGGMSIYGGFIGAVLAAFLYMRWKKLNVWKYSDAMIFGLPLGLFIGRLGCFLIHDHPGTATSFILGVKYPDGIVRHDHGLYLSINGLLLFVAFLILAKKKAREGAYLATFAVWYGVVRFVLDFYRAYDGGHVDARYFGLTPAQYASVGLFAFGLFLFYRMYKKKK